MQSVKIWQFFFHLISPKKVKLSQKFLPLSLMKQTLFKVRLACGCISGLCVLVAFLRSCVSPTRPWEHKTFKFYSFMFIMTQLFQCVAFLLGVFWGVFLPWLTRLCFFHRCIFPYFHLDCTINGKKNSWFLDELLKSVVANMGNGGWKILLSRSNKCFFTLFNSKKICLIKESDDYFTKWSWTWWRQVFSFFVCSF